MDPLVGAFGAQAVRPCPARFPFTVIPTKALLRSSLPAILLLASSAALFAQKLPTPDRDDGAIKLPPGFRAVVVADDLGPLRFIAVAPNGDLYAKMRTVGIIALRDTNGDGRAEERAAFGSGGGTGIAIQGGFLYHSTSTSVLRYRLTPGELVPRGEPETMVTGLPDERQHNAKSFAFDEAGMLYVEVGSPSNGFGQPDRVRGAKGGDPTEFFKKHGGFWRFDPNRLNQTQADGYRFSTGHRHVLSIARQPVSKQFFVVMMGRDQLNTVAPEFYTDEDNAEGPAEELHLLREGGVLGWPFTYYDFRRKARMVAPEYGGDNNKQAEAGKYPEPLVTFPAHWAPLQMAFYSGDQFPAKYRGGAFVAFHGSWNRAPKPQKGYNVAFVPFDEKGMPTGGYEVFADGFAGRDEVLTPRDARFRPGGLAVGPDGSLYVADTVRGRVWRIFYTGEAPPAALPSPTPTPTASLPTPSTAAPAADRGETVYLEVCALCHMPDGAGVPNMQPPLTKTGMLSGDPTALIRLVLYGPDAVLPKNRPAYQNPMPELSSLTDEEIAASLNYARRKFAGIESVLTPEQVRAERGKTPKPGR